MKYNSLQQVYYKKNQEKNKKIEIENIGQSRTSYFEFGMGWLPDYADFRDYTYKTKKLDPSLEALGERDSIDTMLTTLRVTKPQKAGLTSMVDLRKWCSPIENQQTIGSCTAHAGVGQVEYFERRSFGKHIDASRLFLYKVTRNLLHWNGDTGAFLRTTMGALRLFGVPPEEYWTYNIQNFDEEPTPFCYSFAQNFQAVQYYRLDPPNTSPTDLLSRIKFFLAAGLPSIFGFTVFDSIDQTNYNGKIPYPSFYEKILGGHAVMAVGYDDEISITNTNNGDTTTGALLIRNSWGKQWGEEGYGWLPYEYVLTGLAEDWWSLLKNEWVNTGKFGL